MDLSKAFYTHGSICKPRALSSSIIINYMDSNISQEHIYTVSELNDEVSGLLSSNFGIIWIEGEISNYMKSAAGHAYFSLKDSNSSVRCAMFRIQNQSIGFAMEDGQHILAKAKVGLYQARGEYQLVIEYAEQAGEGLLRQKFELLKNKLESEGLFDSVHKQSLPYIPNKIGVISSPKGAAIQDIFNTIKRRFNLVELLVYPTMVQGKEASYQICQAIASANQDNQCSVIILARGGGSLEDLWCFNDEEVARSIFNSKIPIVTGIGHETDVTIADMIADVRAPTPTAAAEIVLPDKLEIQKTLSSLSKQITQSFSIALTNLRHALTKSHLKLEENHPRRKLQQHQQRLDFILERIKATPKTYADNLRLRLNDDHNSLSLVNPNFSINTMQQDLRLKQNNLPSLMKNLLKAKENRFSIVLAKLESSSPLTALSRGYAYITDKDTGKNIRSIDSLKKGSILSTRIKDGLFESSVTRIKKIKD